MAFANINFVLLLLKFEQLFCTLYYEN